MQKLDINQFKSPKTQQQINQFDLTLSSSLSLIWSAYCLLTEIRDEAVSRQASWTDTETPGPSPSP
jgi:hypothetical protein